MIDLNENFSEEQYNIFSNRTIPKCVNSTEEYFKLKYGENLYKEFYEKTVDKRSKKPSPYKIEYWINKGFNEEESKLKIEEYKSNKATTLKNFIKRYGKEKSEEISKSKGSTLENYIKKYGEEQGTLKYNTWKNTVGKNKEYYIEKYGEEKTSKIIASKVYTLDKSI